MADVDRRASSPVPALFLPILATLSPAAFLANYNIADNTINSRSTLPLRDSEETTCRNVLRAKRIVPGVASCSIRVARCAVSPTAVYSSRRSMLIARTTTSPEFNPTRICMPVPRSPGISAA